MRILAPLKLQPTYSDVTRPAPNEADSITVPSNAHPSSLAPSAENCTRRLPRKSCDSSRCPDRTILSESDRSRRPTRRTLKCISAGWEDIGTCLLYTSDAADDLLCVDLGGRRII